MAKRGVGLRGRTIVALGLIAFLAVAVSVIWRRSVGSGQARELHKLGTLEAALEAQRAQLQGDIRRAASRQSLVPVAERLGMRVPNDSQVILLALPRAKAR